MYLQIELQIFLALNYTTKTDLVLRDLERIVNKSIKQIDTNQLSMRPYLTSLKLKLI